MSADNGIYIAKFPDGYRVTEVVGCIENIDYHRPGTKARRKMLASYFGNSKVYKLFVLANWQAWKIYKEWERYESEEGMGCPIEYGIGYVGEYESFAENK
jgi:hypothetical protein